MRTGVLRHIAAASRSPAPRRRHDDAGRADPRRAAAGDDPRRGRAAERREPRARGRRARRRCVPTDVESANLLTVSTVARARRDRARRESRGTHTRSDHPEPSAAFLGRFVFTGDAVARVRAARPSRAVATSRAHDERLRRAGARRAGARRRARWPRTSGRSATSPPRSSPPTPRATVDVVARAGRRDRRHRVRDRGVRAARPRGLGELAGRRRRRASAPAPSSARSSGPLALGAHRRAHRAQLPVPPVGGRRRSPAGSSRPRDRRRGSGTPARRSLGSGRSRRRRCAPGRREPPRLAVGVRAREGQPPRRPGDHRRRRPGPGAVAGPHGRGRVRPARRRSQEAIAAGATMVLLDNMTPDDGARVRVAGPQPPRRRASSSRCRAA